MSNICTMLKQDHQTARATIAKLREPAGAVAETREKLFAQLRKELLLHMEFEEDSFYPAYLEACDSADEIEEAVEEHAGARELLDQLNTADKSDDSWLTTLEELQTALEHHIGEEETEMFPAAEAEMEGEKLNSLGGEYAELKREQLGKAA